MTRRQSSYGVFMSAAPSTAITVSRFATISPPCHARTKANELVRAVTTSVTAPRQDFENNALGTFNVLEAVRHICPEATLIYSSTNKVYGGLEDVKVRETAEVDTPAFLNSVL